MPHSDSFSPLDARAEIADVKIRQAAAVLDEAIDDISPKNRAAPESARDVWAALDDRVRDAARTRPYTTLAIVGLAGFLYAATRRR